MGDNAAYNKRAAKDLGYTLFGCIAHSVHLMCLQLLKAFPNVQVLLSKMCLWLKVGVSNARMITLCKFLEEKCSIPPAKTKRSLTPIKTRWGTYLNACVFIHQHREWITQFVVTCPQQSALKTLLGGLLGDVRIRIAFGCIATLAPSLTKILLLAQDDQCQGDVLCKMLDGLHRCIGVGLTSERIVIPSFTMDDCEELLLDESEDAASMVAPAVQTFTLEVRIKAMFRSTVFRLCPDEWPDAAKVTEYKAAELCLLSAFQAMHVRYRHITNTVSYLKIRSLFDTSQGRAVPPTVATIVNHPLFQRVRDDVIKAEEEDIVSITNAVEAYCNGWPYSDPDRAEEADTEGIDPYKFWSDVSCVGKEYEPLRCIAWHFLVAASSSAAAERIFSRVKVRTTRIRTRQEGMQAELEMMCATNKGLLCAMEEVGSRVDEEEEDEVVVIST